MTTPPDLGRVPFAMEPARHGSRRADLTVDRVLTCREPVARVGIPAVRLVVLHDTSLAARFPCRTVAVRAARTSLLCRTGSVVRRGGARG